MAESRTLPKPTEPPGARPRTLPSPRSWPSSKAGAWASRSAASTPTGAVILLGGEQAWKLKRPVRFSFMDFSTLERRHAALKAELDLNRRTAPAIYEALLPVTRNAAGRLSLHDGEPVEWLLRMRRFPEAAQLDRLADRGGLTTAVLEALAAEIARFHDAAEVIDAGPTAGMRRVVEGNVGDLAGLVPDMLPGAEVAALNERSLAELAIRDRAS